MENNDKIFIDGDFNDSYEARIQRSKGKKKNKSEPPSPTASGSVAAPKEEEKELQAEIVAFELVKSKDLIDECYHYLKANPPSKVTANYSKWESLVEETDYLRKYNADAEHERINREDYQDELTSIRQQLEQREEALKELLPIAERKFNGITIDDAASHREYIALKAIIERARKLISK